MKESISRSQKIRQILTTGLIFASFISSPIIGWGLWLYLLTTRFWWFSFFYTFWLYYDRNTPETGGRPIAWLQNSNRWNDFIKYFSPELTAVPDFSLDSNKNYLFCYFPHGIIPIGSYITLTCGESKFRKRNRRFGVQMATLNFMLFTPFMRDLGMGIGLVSCSAKSLDHILSRPNGAHIVNLSPGGGQEAYCSHPGRYCFYVQNRRGFVRAAFRNGVALVPVITFGEVDLFCTIQNQKTRWLQNFFGRKFGFAPILFYGTGFFSSYGLIPRQKPLMTVLGKPIEVSKIEKPTDQEIDDLHARFVQELVSLFDTYKHKFFDNPEDQHLELR